MLKAVGAALLAALVITGLAAGAAQKSETYKLSAKLTAGAEVPKPKGVPAAAKGSFTDTTVEPKSGPVKLTWKLTFSGLSGKARGRAYPSRAQGQGRQRARGALRPLQERPDRASGCRPQRRARARGGARRT